MVFLTAQLWLRNRVTDRYFRIQEVLKHARHFRGRKNRCYSLAVRAVIRAFVKCTKARYLKKKNMRTVSVDPGHRPARALAAPASLLRDPASVQPLGHPQLLPFFLSYLASKLRQIMSPRRLTVGHPFSRPPRHPHCQPLLQPLARATAEPPCHSSCVASHRPSRCCSHLPSGGFPSLRQLKSTQPLAHPPGPLSAAVVVLVEPTPAGNLCTPGTPGIFERLAPPLCPRAISFLRLTTPTSAS
uniref:Mitochondrial ribosomal protein L20 n=1 Tax=Macaca mulatta TaxID=9544 RepID=A0A5F7ZBY6_MACMU